jgi:transcriptional regulator
VARHEAWRSEPWSVDDAPPSYIDGQLRAIVGVEVVISHIEAKLKLSQNRSATDVDGAIDGLAATGDPHSVEMAALMRAVEDVRGR